jgi:hypothetical protein
VARYHGRRSRVLMSTTAAGAASEVIGIRSWSYSQEVDTVEVTAFGDTNKRYVQGLPDATGEFEGFWEDSEAKIWAAVASGDGVKIYMYPDHTNAPSKYVYGPAWLSASIETAVDGAVTISASFAANGAWGSTL